MKHHNVEKLSFVSCDCSLVSFGDLQNLTELHFCPDSIVPIRIVEQICTNFVGNLTELKVPNIPAAFVPLVTQNHQKIRGWFTQVTISRWFKPPSPFKLMWIVGSVTSKKSPIVYKSCPKMISLEKWWILTPLQKFPKNVGDLGKIIFAKGLKKLSKF